MRKLPREPIRKPKEKMSPDTRQIAIELIDKGRVVDGYTLIYLQQIRDLLDKILHR